MSERASDLRKAASAAVLDHVDEIGQHFVKGIEEQLAPKVREIRDDIGDLRERIEEIEAKGVRPGKTADNAKPREWKTYYSGRDLIHELPSHVKMADVLPAEKAPVSFDRWLGAAMAGERMGDTEALAFAREQKQLLTSTSGVLIPAQYQSEWIDLIRSQMVLNAAGLTTAVMDAKTYNASAVVTDPAVTWHTEGGSINADNPTFAARTLTAKTLVVRCQGSVEVAQDCPNFGQQLASVMSRAMAVELDRVGLVGTGTPPEPKGILGASGVNVVGSVGAISNYSEMLEAVGALLQANIPLETATRFAIMSPGVWEIYEGLATGIASDKTQLPRPRALQNTRFLVTTHGGVDVNEDSPQNSPSTVESTVFMGDFSDVVLGVRREASVEALKLTTYASNLLLEFVGYLRADYMIRRPASLVTMTGIEAGPA